ncbi:MAG: hypothetical protein GY855_06895 [candidate division Zixibacteria bacterium]|nr:hypothetical protein [candidate division Zixibacteria bacterium]
MEVYYDSADKDIDVRFNFIDVGDEYFDTLNVNTWIHNPWNGQFELKTGLNEEGWNKLLFNGISKTLNFTFMDVRYLGLNYATDILGFEDNTIFGIPIPPMPLDIAAWFPEGYIYYVDADRQEMNLHLGLAINPINDPAVDPDAVPSPNPIGHYYSTPGDELPVLATEDGNNLTIGLNDDVINMGAWAAMEAGGFDGLNITSQFRYITGQALANSVFRKAVAKVYMQAPPIADFSGSGYTESYPDGDGIVSNAGTFRIRDMIIEVTDLLANQINDRAILSIDTDVNINLRLSEDGKRIEGYMGSQSMMNIATLYYGNVELTNLVSLAPAITDYVTDLAIRALLKFNVPKIETYDANIQPEISSISVGDNNMIVKLNITRPEITE